jgi:hypothetical protein
MRVSLFAVLLLASSSDAFVSRPATPIRFHGALKAGTELEHDTTSDKFCVGILGDLHIDPRYMEDYETGRDQWLNILKEHKETYAGNNVALVSLGDLGESKSVRPDETNELFAGTTECHELAAEFLGSFGVPYEVVGGNHGE